MFNKNNILWAEVNKASFGVSGFVLACRNGIGGDYPPTLNRLSSWLTPKPFIWHVLVKHLNLDLGWDALFHRFDMADYTDHLAVLERQHSGLSRESASRAGIQCFRIQRAKTFIQEK